jgi:hypothetical protein
MSNLPEWWRRASFTAKAAYLVRTGEAIDFAAACSIMAQRRRRKVPRPAAKARLPYADN